MVAIGAGEEKAFENEKEASADIGDGKAGGIIREKGDAWGKGNGIEDECGEAGGLETNTEVRGCKVAKETNAGAAMIWKR